MSTENGPDMPDYIPPSIPTTHTTTTPTPAPVAADLPTTGMDLAPLGLAAALVVAGLAAVFAARRRKSA